MSLFTGLITSRMRVRVLMRLFLNPEQQIHIRQLADETGSSPSQVSDELKNLSKSGLLTAARHGKYVKFQANRDHPLYPELNSMVKKALGMDSVLESIVRRLGKLDQAYLIDDYAEGRDSGLIDLVLVGDIDKKNLDDLVVKTERYINRKIRTLVLDRREFDNMHALNGRPRCLLWSSGCEGPGGLTRGKDELEKD